MPHPIKSLILGILVSTSGVVSAIAENEVTHLEDAAISEDTPLEAAVPERDAASKRLVANFFTATGGTEAHQKIEAVRVTGTKQISRVDYQFELVEARDGRRWLRTRWRNYEDLGRIYERIVATDGTAAGTWQQNKAPRRRDAEHLGGAEAVEFRELFWILNPLQRDCAKAWNLSFQGRMKTFGRDTFLVRAWQQSENGDDENERPPYWFYFDAETFLILRHGGVGDIGSAKGAHELVIPRYRPVSEIQLPQQIRFLAQNDTFGRATIEEVELNPELPDDFFKLPEPSSDVWLRQREHE